MHQSIFNELSSKLATLDRYLFLPKGYKGDVDTLPFIYVSIVSKRSMNSDHSGSRGYHGIFHFTIIWTSSEGPKTGFDVVTYLEDNLENQRLNTLQTFVGSAQMLDSDLYNSALSRMEYTLPFIYYG
jgi:hypothetical protein